MSNDATTDTKAPSSSPFGDISMAVTPAAIAAIEAARKEEGEESVLLLEITESFEHSLNFAPPREDLLVVTAAGIPFALDEASAKRAEGVEIDYVERDDTAGFRIHNPNKERMLAEKAEPIALPEAETAPAMTVTKEAREQFDAALSAEDEEHGGPHSVKVVAKRMGATRAEYELNILSPNEVSPNDFRVDLDGMIFYVDRASARILDGITIDFVDGDYGAGFKFKNPRIESGWSDPVAAKIQDVIEKDINPMVAAHGGYVDLLDVAGSTAFVLMGGGCQGCGMASVTLSQGVATKIKETVPEITRVVDTTDHASGTNPYYQG